MSPLIGRAVPRVDGHAKVTGGARYAADTHVPGVTYGTLATSTIARGTITTIDTTLAQAVPGVIAVFTHLTMPRLVTPPSPYPKGFVPLQDATIHHNGQPVAYVVAQTLEQAQEAAALIDVRYHAEPAKVAIDDAPGEEFLPPPGPEGPQEFVHGDPAAGLANAHKKVDATYSSPVHHHNPIETSATVAVWDGDQLTLHESTQSISLTQQIVAQALSVPQNTIRVLTPFLGGGFGSKAPVWPHTLLTAAVARQLRKPVKLVLTRAQMYTSSGHRAEFRQQVTVGAAKDGTLTAIVNISNQQLSRTEQRVFNTSESSWMVYGCPNIHAKQLGVRLDLPTPHFMRSPEGPALVGLEMALDELSYELGMDPVALRLKNYTDLNPENGQKIGNQNLPECLKLAGDAFGWSRRNPTPRSMRDGNELIGWGMATEAHSYHARASSAWVQIDTDGHALARCGTQDIGTGTYTVMTQVTAEALGMPMNSVRFELGDTNFPAAGFSAASVTVSSVSGSVDKAARAARDAVIALAVADPHSPLHGAAPDRIVTEHGFLFLTDDRTRRDSYQGVVSRHGKPVEATGSFLNVPGYTTGASFIEVRVDPWLGRVRVTRAVAAYDIGRVMNHRTARSQVLGGMIWGVGYALTEHTMIDRHTARIVNPNLSGYLVPVNADAPKIEAFFVDKPDPTSPVGAKGFGEAPITGVPAAISNAIYHATGRRIRDLPITQDKLL
ncbi:xanthine dehydrogenase family protein molybdopterin-binding subunit [Solihabitans fulvus]|uniref:Xanthine dehydrogenase family protein molybdopterin-binding subunit n=1 Tax=Solihabitans fulvus TaxID=1892852 RepID=A0A5B2WJ85_9PSEU|nr:xanthine dehydrogenase family protein molybdopterin-binding subunit [Solihabitans fulvus]KAA2250752.1 xanthine dehydrogenase family protein molybdopterin-binding subunit [Solihabitans fulvus]